MMVLLENPDVTSHVLSYLNIVDLANCGFTSKKLSENVFGSCDENRSNDAAWIGAEKMLTGTNGRIETISSAREHCRLFIEAAKHAKKFHESETPPEEGTWEMDMAFDFMNIRGFHRESLSYSEVSKDDVADQRRFFDQLHWTDEEWTTFEVNEQARIATIEAEVQQNADTTSLRNNYEFAIFVRVSRNESGECIGQGFVPWGRFVGKWYAPIDYHTMVFRLQGKEMGLVDSKEFISLCQKPRFGNDHMHYEKQKEYSNAFQFTIVAISKYDLKVRLLRRTCFDEQRYSVAYDINRFEFKKKFAEPPMESRINYFPLVSKWDLKRFHFQPNDFGRHCFLTCNIGVAAYTKASHWTHKEFHAEFIPVLVLHFKNNPGHFLMQHPFKKMASLMIGSGDHVEVQEED